MSSVTLSPTHLMVQLTPAEKLLGLHGDFKIPAALVRGADVADKDTWKTLGVRIPGTAVPGLILYGHYWQPGKPGDPIAGWAFALWRSRRPAITITLATAKGQKFKRLLLSLPKTATVADAKTLADTINDAILAC